MLLAALMACVVGDGHSQAYSFAQVVSEHGAGPPQRYQHDTEDHHQHYNTLVHTVTKQVSIAK